MGEGAIIQGGDYFKYFRLKGGLIETKLLLEGTLHSWSSSLPFSKLEYKAGNHPSPTVSIQDNDLGFSPIQCACKDGWIILCWVKVVRVYKIYSLRDWTSVNVGSSLAAPIRSLVVFTVSHPDLVNVNRSNVIWDVSRRAEIYFPLACKAGRFSFSCAQRPLRRCLRTPETRKQLSRLQTQLTSLALVEQKYGLLASSSSIQVRDWENQNSSDKNTYQMFQ